ncbi:uncharacterized protein LOC113459339 [Zonotrichia albicollis]|uniref:uncharacterized protein LOC113459339 n=1 Tax=Zonotrichia albicollis TaxID=44394 RepID=UPI003D80F757
MAAPGSSVRSAHGHPPHAGGAEAQRALRGAHTRPHAPHTHPHTRARAPGEPRGRARRARAARRRAPARRGRGRPAERRAVPAPPSAAGRRRAALPGGCPRVTARRRRQQPAPWSFAQPARTGIQRTATPHADTSAARPPRHSSAPRTPGLRSHFRQHGPTFPRSCTALDAAPAARTPRAEVRGRPVLSRSARWPRPAGAERSRGEGGGGSRWRGGLQCRCSLCGACAAFAGTVWNWAVAGKQSVGFRTRILRHRGRGRVSEPFSFTFLLCPPQRRVAEGAGARMHQRHLKDSSRPPPPCPPGRSRGSAGARVAGRAAERSGRGAAPPAAARGQRRAADGPAGRGAAGSGRRRRGERVPFVPFVPGG